MKRLFIYLLAASLLSSGQQAMADTDPVLNALTDEMNRSMQQLHIDNHPAPYFISYQLKEINDVSFDSCLGSPAAIIKTRSRALIPDVRLGTPDLDSSYISRPPSVVSAPIDDDYAAMRRTAWIGTDRAYKSAVTNFEWKKAYLAANSVPDRTPDLSVEQPVVSVEPVPPLAVDESKWSDTVQKLSLIFKAQPTVQKSRVTFIARNVTRWFVNSEGTRIRDCQPKYGLIMWASTQADDGMPLSDYVMVGTGSENEMPAYETLKEAEDLAKRVADLRQAPKGEEYCGPVLFEGQAAAELFSQVLAPNLGYGETALGSQDTRNPFKNAIGRRILPKQISITDNPLATTYNGTPLFGGYKFDDDGVPAQKVDLVENGVLKHLCQSRVPLKAHSQSNGHSMCGRGVANILTVQTSKPSSTEEMKHDLTDLAKDAGLDYVIVISRINDGMHMAERPTAEEPSLDYPTPEYSRQPSDPVVAYKLYITDGRRELIRGLEFRNISLRAFRDIQAMGDDAAAYLVEPQDRKPRHVIIPSFIVGELELTPMKPEHSTPPISPSPILSEASH